MAPLGQAIEQGHQQWRTAMQAAVKTTGAEATDQVTLFMEEHIGTPEVSAKIKRGHQGDSQNFRIADLTLWVFIVLERLQEIITQAINEYNLQVHRGSSLRVVE
jgi:hypothetical protein